MPTSQDPINLTNDSEPLQNGLCLCSSFPNSVWERRARNSVSAAEPQQDAPIRVHSAKQSFAVWRSQHGVGNEDTPGPFNDNQRYLPAMLSRGTPRRQAPTKDTSLRQPHKRREVLESGRPIAPG